MAKAKKPKKGDKANAKVSKATRKKAQHAVGSAKRKAAAKRRTKATSKSEKNPSGVKGLTNAEKSVRDTLIVERVALGWDWKDIAAEAGISVDQSQRNYRARVKLLPKLASMDPLKIVEMLVQGFQSSVVDFEKMAQQYADRNPAAAVGAKKAAVETRKEIAALMQSTGQLPHDLGELRHIVDVRVAVQALLISVDRFQDRVKGIDLPKEKRKLVLEAAGGLTDDLRELASPPPVTPDPKEK